MNERRRGWATQAVHQLQATVVWVSLLNTHTPLAPPLEVSRAPHIAESRRYRARSQAQPLHQAHMGV